MHILTEIPDCVLRPWQYSDKASLIRHANNRKIWRNLTGMFPSPYTGPDADYWFSMVSSPGSSIFLAIEVAGEAVGGIGVIAGEGIHEYSGHLGYWLGESLWGRGIATASVRSLSDYSLSKTKFVRLEAPVFAWNPASMRVLDKVGFKKEGVLEKSGFKDGQFIDIAMYAKVKSA